MEDVTQMQEFPLSQNTFGNMVPSRGQTALLFVEGRNVPT